MNRKSPPIHRTAKYRAKAAYKNMKRRCLNTCGSEPNYINVKLLFTEKEWMDWAVPEYEKCMSLYPNESPSVSRKGDEGDYAPGNVEIIPFKKNRSLQNQPGQLFNGLKRCSTCKIKKEPKDFHNSKYSNDRLFHQCKNCCKLRNQKYKQKLNGGMSIILNAPVF